MITVTIGQEVRPLNDVDSHWVTQQIERRLRDGISVCVAVKIDVSGAKLSLATPACGGRGGSNREFTALESKLISKWTQLGLNKPDFSPGSVNAFIQRLRQLVR